MSACNKHPSAVALMEDFLIYKVFNYNSYYFKAIFQQFINFSKTLEMKKVSAVVKM